ncbi:hypothetical protein [Mycoplasma todarodis]|uniref:hypothetical protein n=1 Tax=Mycoplasma todarodis TaxID=1937191 RepID=UPI003B506341
MKKVKKYNPNKIATKEGSIFPLNDNIISYKFFKKDISKPDNQGIQRFASQWEYFVEIQFIPATKKEKVKIYEITSYEYDLHTKR